MDKKLFTDFIPSDKSVWQKQVEKEIKNPASELNKNNRGVYRKNDPYYSFEEFDARRFETLNYYQKKNPGWLNMPEIKIADFTSTNQKIQQAILSGAQAILIKSETNNLTQNDMARLLHNIQNADIPVYIKTGQEPNQIFNLLVKESEHIIKGGIAHDYVASWMADLKPFDHTLVDIASLCKRTEGMAHFYPIMVESHIFHQAGASAEQELAYLMGSLTFYLDKLTDAGLSADLIFKNIFISVSVGTEYLIEIAKLRALRLLLGRVAAAYGVDNQTTFLHTIISTLYSSNAQPYTNILRSTSAAMSSAIGGCDMLTIPAFDEPFSEPSDFSERIARNVSSIMSNEGYINQVADPAAGSYYIEKQSQDLADAAWTLFLDLENRGGIIASFESGYIQDEIDKSWLAKTQAMEHGYIMVGVNKYQESVNATLRPQPDLKVQQSGYRALPNRNLSIYWNNLHH